jgi:hypothetical protein
MIVGNTLSEIGDVLIIDTQVSISGSSVQLTNYVDETIGETATRFFDKKFRVSHDGLIFTDWYELNNLNVSQISGSIINNSLFIQYRYERVGTDNTGLLELINVSINGNVTIVEYNTPITDNSIFKGLSCGNFVTMQLCNNLLKKLYKKGIIPEYIQRGVISEDEDYIAFWSTIACYMSMFVTYMYSFENIYMQRNLLVEYLKQLDIKLCDFNTTLEDLQYISDNYLDEIRKRGTKSVFLRKNEIYQDSEIVPVDGEILRSLCIDEQEEFIWTLRQLKHTGFNIGNSSPMYRGNCFDINLIKAFEKTYGFTDLSKYLTFGSDITHNISNKTLEIDSTLSPNGLGFEDFNAETSVSDYGILVNPSLDYEITIELSVSDATNVISFGCYVYDIHNNKYTTLEVHTGNINEFFIKNYTITQLNNKILIRGIVYGYKQRLLNFEDRFTNLSTGRNLKFGNLNITKLMPYVKIENSNAIIYDLKIRPLRYNHSIGFLITANIIELFANNKNREKTINDVYNIIRRDLIPYNTNLIINLTDSQSIPSDSIIYMHLDTTSMSSTDLQAIETTILSWWEDFKLLNPDFNGSLLINTVDNSIIGNNYASGRGGRSKNTITGSNINTGGSNVEKWLQNPAEGLLRFSWKEGSANFANEQAFIDYIKGRSLIVLSFIDETHPDYHASFPVNFVGQPTAAYITDYNNFTTKIVNNLKYFKGTLYPITRVNSTNNNVFLLHGIAAIEGRNLTVSEVDKILGVKKLSYSQINLQNYFYNNLSNNPYYIYDKLKKFGWSGDFTKVSPAAAVFSSNEFKEQLNELVGTKVKNNSIIY